MPFQLANSPHADFDGDGNRDKQVPYYKHEFAMFTRRMTREIFLPADTYVIKIVTQDSRDKKVNSAVFLAENGVRVRTIPYTPGDYDNNGIVDQGDLDLVLLNWGSPAHPLPNGWKNISNLPIGIIDQEEMDWVLLNWGKKPPRADFNRDGLVNGADLAILNQFKNQLLDCASRFEGDANADGKVDAADEAIWLAESN